ncbi:MAG: hypothetical protein JOZ42_08885, partial [Acetobacteraceae bacterium]|nr:hypothetical protein [Acetobacteraceae bacterium]
MTIGRKLFRCCTGLVLIALLLGLVSAVNADEEYPLRPADTSSPRATLGGFIKTTDDIYSRMRAVLQTYAESDRMHMTAD